MSRDPFDLDDLFKRIEKEIEKMEQDRIYGGHKYDTSNYSDNIMEDKDHIYFTVDIDKEPRHLDADVEDSILKLTIDTSIERIRLPTTVRKVSKITCNNGILDIVLDKYDEERRD